MFHKSFQQVSGCVPVVENWTTTLICEIRKFKWKTVYYLKRRGWQSLTKAILPIIRKK